MLTKSVYSNPILRLLVGVVFIFSGLIKLNDPVGFSITIETYIQGFAIDFGAFFLSLINYSLPIAIIVCVIEVILGAALILKFEIKFIIRALLLLTGFFTVLVLYTLWFRPINSCGCLSSAIPLTPRQSLIKNIFLLIALHLLNKHTRYKARSGSTVIYLILVGIFSTGIGWYAARKLPIIDFGPYQIGSNIPSLIYPSNNAQDKEDSRLDSTNISRLTGSELIRPNVKTKIMDFIVWSDIQEITQEILEGTQLLGIIHKPTTLKDKEITDLQKVITNTLSPLKILWLLPLNVEKEDLPSFMITHIAWGNTGMLQSMIRSNIGFVLLQDGIVIGKWSYKDLPKLEGDLNKLGFYKLNG